MSSIRPCPQGYLLPPCVVWLIWHGLANMAWCNWLFILIARVFSFSRGKKTFFQKVLKKWSSIQKNRKYFYHFLGGGVRPQSDDNHFFWKPSLMKSVIVIFHPRYLSLTTTFFYYPVWYLYIPQRQMIYLTT